jgi:UDP-N-acetylmuramoylalanine--D-glutamate ligase
MPEMREETGSVSVIVGLGDTGLSVAKYLAAIGEPFRGVDTRQNPPGLSELRRLFPEMRIDLGALEDAALQDARQLIVSPGISLKTQAIAAARLAGVPVTGDIALFANAVSAPIIAVTGSNGKSTVVALVAAILRQAGINFGLGGNLDGVNFRPALELLQEPEKEMYVLELSSFQLETTAQLGAEVAIVLNISPDHMDRYVDVMEYRQAKQAIFNGCKQFVVNRDDDTSRPLADLGEPTIDFGLGEPGPAGIGITEREGQRFIVIGTETLLPVDALKIVGQHNLGNAMAAIALALAAGIDKDAIRTAVASFAGLPHRCQWVAEIEGVQFYNDSKGTNVGATIAAIEGLGARLDGRIVLIAGGVGKGADFSVLAPVVQQWTRAVILIGQDAMQIASHIERTTSVIFADDMPSAVKLSLQLAQPGDAVLLSPACASFDMFDNFQHRGFTFMQLVESLQ